MNQESVESIKKVLSVLNNRVIQIVGPDLYDKKFKSTVSRVSGLIGSIKSDKNAGTTIVKNYSSPEKLNPLEQIPAEKQQQRNKLAEFLFPESNKQSGIDKDASKSVQRSLSAINLNLHKIHIAIANLLTLMLNTENNEIESEDDAIRLQYDEDTKVKQKNKKGKTSSIFSALVKSIGLLSLVFLPQILGIVKGLVDIFKEGGVDALIENIRKNLQPLTQWWENFSETLVGQIIESLYKGFMDVFNEAIVKPLQNLANEILGVLDPGELDREGSELAKVMRMPSVYDSSDADIIKDFTSKLNQENLTRVDVPVRRAVAELTEAEAAKYFSDAGYTGKEFDEYMSRFRQYKKNVNKQNWNAKVKKMAATRLDNLKYHGRYNSKNAWTEEYQYDNNGLVKGVDFILLDPENSNQILRKESFEYDPNTKQFIQTNSEVNKGGVTAAPIIENLGPMDTGPIPISDNTPSLESNPELAETINTPVPSPMSLIANNARPNRMPQNQQQSVDLSGRNVAIDIPKGSADSPVFSDIVSDLVWA